MPRKKRPLDRDAGVVRDASLIVIASEDTYAVKDYFLRFKTRRVQFKVIPTEDGRSAPAAVIARLDQFKNDVATEESDQFWLCIDKDQVHPPEAYASESPTVHAARRSTGASSLPRIFPHDGNRGEAPVLLLLLDLAPQSFVARASAG